MKRIFLAAALMALVATYVAEMRPVSAQFNNGRRFNCVVQTSTATTIQAVGGDCIAPTGGQALHITQISFSANAGGIAADSYPTLKFGTGGTCGTGTTIFWLQMIPAATQAVAGQNLPTQIDIPAGNEICWIDSTAGSKAIVIGGFIS